MAAAHVRWSERVDAGRLVGAGVDYEAPPVGRWRPAVVLDAWKNPDQTFGGRVEARAAWSRTASDRWMLIGAVGGKGRGYLFGFPDRKRLYASVGAGLEF